MKLTAVLMAGGRGERFWPRSRQHLPKQFLSLTDGGLTMLQQTAARLAPLVQMQDLYVVAGREYASVIEQQLPELPVQNILSEPMPRSTAPAIALAAAVIGQKYDDAVMLVLPSDHLVQPLEGFWDTLRSAAELAQRRPGHLITLGIPPAYAETGYGYIRFDPAGEEGYYPVEAFTEKPDLQAAKAYVASGRYLWNSGMFVWTLSTIRESLKTLMPALYSGMKQISRAWGKPDFEQVLERTYAAWPAESIDYGMMERAEHIDVVPARFAWDDAGSWLVMQRLHQADDDGNVALGNTAAVDSRNCILVGGQRLIAALGVENLVIVDTGDALLVCDKRHAQDIKKITARLKDEGYHRYL